MFIDCSTIKDAITHSSLRHLQILNINAGRVPFGKQVWIYCNRSDPVTAVK